MKTRKTGKLALFSSVVCLILCCSMLLGSTYAWFTDDVTNESNIIASGTLKVVMEYSKDGTSWTDASEGEIFNYELWEPGYTDVKYIKIENKGNLAFKFSLKLIPDLTTNTSVKLAEVIEVYMGAGAATRGDMAKMVYVGTLADLMADPDGAAYGKMLAGDSQTYCIALKMQESAGNEYQNLSVGDGIAIQLYAEQYTYEEDSFDSNYDANAGLPAATVTYLNVPEQDMYIIPDITQGFGGGSNIRIKPDAAFTFIAQENAQTIAEHPYKDWLVDYYVSIDAPVEDGIILIGNYDNWQSGAWYGFNVPAGDYTTATPLLGTMTGGISNWTYEEIVTGVGVFNCGVVNTNSANVGKNMTVELRIMNPADPTQYYVICSTVHTLTKCAPSDLPVATVTNLDVPKQEMYIISDLSQGFGSGTDVEVEPDAAFKFVAQDDAASVATNPYKDWLVDYYVSINETVEDGVTLIGAYGNWQSGAWYGFNVPAGDYTTATPLLGTMTGGVSNWTYEDIVTGVGEFNCGVVNTNDNNNGKVMTVELRIINPDDSSEYYVISSTTHTFQ